MSNLVEQTARFLSGNRPPVHEKSLSDAEIEDLLDKGKEVVANTVSVARSVTGTVVSNKMDKTITLRVERRVKHPVYGKFVRKSKKIHAHDAENVCSIGDVVTVEECRPLSKTKSWMLKSVEAKASEV